MTVARVPRDAYLLLALATLCVADTYREGTYGRVPFALVMLAILMTVAATLANDHHAPRGLWGAAAAACALSELYEARYWPVWGAALVVASAMCLGLAMLARRKSSVVVLVVAGVCLALGMASIQWTWGRSTLDVFNAVQNASNSLIHGHNPYSATFQTFVPTSARSAVSRTAHYAYGPSVPVLVAPGRVLGDVRVVSVLAFALLIAFTVKLASQAPDGPSRRWRVLPLCVAVPLTIGMVDVGWIDVYMVAGYAGWLALRRTHPRWAVACLAVSLTVKPTILVAVLLPALWSRRARRETLMAGSLAVAAFVPFAALTGVGTFYKDLMSNVVTNGPREDGLGLKSYWYWTFGHPFPTGLSIALAALIVAAVACRRPRTYGDMLGASALIMTTSLMLASWAFYNYYFVAVWLLCLALAGGSNPFDETSRVPPFTWLSRFRLFDRAPEVKQLPQPALILPARATPSQ